VRTTLIIDDDLYCRVKAKAALEGRKVTELVEEGMRAVLGEVAPNRSRGQRRRLRLPIIPARPGSEPLFGGMSQDEIHERLSDLQVEAERERVGPSS